MNKLLFGFVSAPFRHWGWYMISVVENKKLINIGIRIYDSCSEICVKPYLDVETICNLSVE